MKFFIKYILFVLYLISQTKSFFFTLQSNTEQCFLFGAEIDKEYKFEYQVSGNHEDDVLDSESKSVLAKYQGQKELKHLITQSNEYKKYKFCFTCKRSDYKEVEITYGENNNILIGSTDYLLELAYMDLQDIYEAFKHAISRTRVHNNLLVLIDTKVRWASIIKTFILFLVCGIQIYTIKKFFGQNNDDPVK